MKNSKLSINRFLILFMIVGFSMVLALLVCLDWYIINGYQRSVRNEWNQQLYLASENLLNNLEELESEAYNIYATDNNFNA